MQDLCRRIPAHPAFGGLLIEVKSSRGNRQSELVVDVAREVRLRNIAVSIDDVGADWPALMGLETFPFAELKVDRQFVTGCANDRLKQTVCRGIIELAKGYGVRVVAEELRPGPILLPQMKWGSTWSRATCSASPRGSRNSPAPPWSIRYLRRSDMNRRRDPSRSTSAFVRPKSWRPDQPSRLICSSVTTRSMFSVLLLIR